MACRRSRTAPASSIRRSRSAVGAVPSDRPHQPLQAARSRRSEMSVEPLRAEQQHAQIAALSPRLRSKIRVAADGCWEWTASRRPDGYGQVWDGKKVNVAHRVIYEALIGRI